MQHIQRMARIPAMRQPQIIGWTRKGRPVYSIAGGAGEGEGGGSEEGEEGEEEDEGGSGGSGSEGGTSGSGEEGAENQKSSGESVSREEFENALERMKAADRRATAAEQKVQEYERKEKSDLENLQTDLEEAQGSLASVTQENQELRMRLAVLTLAGNRFQDPEDVLRFVDYSDIATEEGEIDKKAVKAALDKLAEEKKYLLRQEQEEEEEGKPPSTPPAGGGRKKTGIDQDELKRKYPALRR